MFLFMNFIFYIGATFIFGWFPLYRAIRIIEQREGIMGIFISIAVICFFEIASYVVLSAIDDVTDISKIDGNGKSK